jgi:hypothetical protein
MAFVARLSSDLWASTPRRAAQLHVQGVMMYRDGRTMILCELCGQGKECSQKEIDGKEYDRCSDCWSPLAEKLKGNGRVKKRRETA